MPSHTTIDPVLVSPEFIAQVPRDFARSHCVISQGKEAGQERLVISSATSPDAVWNIGVRLGCPVQISTADPEAIVAALDAAFERLAVSVAEVAAPLTVSSDPESLDVLLDAAERDVLSTAGKAPLSRLLDRMLFDAVQLGASDLHLQPSANGFFLRHRVDGVLEPGRPIPANLLKSLTGRIKVLGRMDVAERLAPQDGRTTISVGERAIDIRISTIPTAFGERVVLRLLDPAKQLLNGSGLGMPSDMAAAFSSATGRASGIILVTGPTGSGKTTTLYSALSALDSSGRNLMTIEDPIEYDLSSMGLPISQSQVNLKKGVNFANGLRHILRQDPDVIMVGEIRDLETARIAIQASLTGHLVLSTLHTNDALSAVTRLVDLGVEPYLVASSLSMVIAQRLVRTLCPSCGGNADRAACAVCRGSGFRGRTGIFELVSLSDSLRAAITAGSALAGLRRIAGEEGMRTLADAGEALVVAGRTTRDEVDRVIHHG